MEPVCGTDSEVIKSTKGTIYHLDICSSTFHLTNSTIV